MMGRVFCWFGSVFFFMNRWRLRFGCLFSLGIGKFYNYGIWLVIINCDWMFFIVDLMDR